MSRERHNILLVQLDGSIPNIALMRIAAHHRERGDAIEMRWAKTMVRVRRQLWDMPDKVYASCIFEKTRPAAEQLLREFPGAIIGGTGWDFKTTIEGLGIKTTHQDYSIYPNYRESIGFTQRGCRLKCSFCVVPRKEGAVQSVSSVWDIWRGEPWPRHIVLLDNDFFGQRDWQKRIEEMRSGDFRVCFNQGINARMLNDETAAAIASVRYSDDQFKRPRIYTAWDNRKDEHRLFAGLEALTRHGVKPDHIMVYMLIGFWPGETEADRLYRQQRLREFGCRPYPMPFSRTPELTGFQRWCVGAYDKRGVSWDRWRRNNFRPEGLMSA